MTSPTGNLTNLNRTGRNAAFILVKPKSTSGIWQNVHLSTNTLAKKVCSLSHNYAPLTLMRVQKFSVFNVINYLRSSSVDKADLQGNSLFSLIAVASTTLQLRRETRGR